MSETQKTGPSDTELLDFIDRAGCDWDGLGAYIAGASYTGDTLRDCIMAAMLASAARESNLKPVPQNGNP